MTNNLVESFLSNSLLNFGMRLNLNIFDIATSEASNVVMVLQPAVVSTTLEVAAAFELLRQAALAQYFQVAVDRAEAYVGEPAADPLVDLVGRWVRGRLLQFLEDGLPLASHPQFSLSSHGRVTFLILIMIIIMMHLIYQFGKGGA